MVYSRIDRILLLTVIVLLVLGSIFVFSSSYFQALRQGESTLYYFIGHIKRLLVALLFFCAGLLIPLDKYQRLIFPGFLLLLLILIFTIVMGKMQYGAKRSIFISSFGIQISEFVRVWIVFFLANFFTRHPDTANKGKGMIIATLLPMFLIILVAAQPSISVAIITFLTLVSMMIYSEAKLKFLMPVILIGVLLFVVAVLLYPHVRLRLFSFISNPTYQVRQSLIAIGSGGLLGRGIGAGIQKFLFLPRIHNDFIFAHIAEETGFMGTFIVFLLYWEIFLRGISIAQSVVDEFARLVVMGLNTTIFLIFLVHVGVSIGLLPPTGIPLPFVSYGGWSLCANLFSMGIILQISRMG